MATANLQPAQPQRSLGRSIGCVIAGLVVGAVASLATDVLMVALGIMPPLGQPVGSRPLFLATGYRTIYGIAASYIAARLAPRRPMAHAMALGVLGLIVSIVGAVVTWNHQPPLGPHWYPVALVVLAIPTAWLGGLLRVKQMESR